MAGSTVTIDGLDEALVASAQLPAAVTAGLRRTAEKTAGKIQAQARANLYHETISDKTPETWAVATAAAITVTVDETNKVVLVTSSPASGDPANNPIWLEHGTIHEAPKPYMLPAVKQFEPQYFADCEAAVAAIASEVLGS